MVAGLILDDDDWKKGDDHPSVSVHLTEEIDKNPYSNSIDFRATSGFNWSNMA